VKNTSSAQFFSCEMFKMRIKHYLTQKNNNLTRGLHCVSRPVKNEYNFRTCLTYRVVALFSVLIEAPGSEVKEPRMWDL
jgi:hypothetical protein